MEREALSESYFSELEPERRLAYLEKISDCPPDNSIEFYRKLWTLRYTDPKDPRHRVDMFLFQIVNLITLYRISGPSFLRKGNEKEIGQSMRALGFSDAARYGSLGRDILYLEFRNAARRYFGTCESKSYGKKLMGIVTMNEDERSIKMAREVWELTEGVPERFEVNDDTALFCKAIRDEYLALCPDGEKRLISCAARRRKRKLAFMK